MDAELLRHLLQLSAKTGDRLIVVDPDSRQPFVLMGIEQYEALRAPNVLSPSGRGGAGRGVGLPREPEPAFAATPAITPGLDVVAQRANAELAAWRAQEPVVPVEASATVEGFSPEPMQSAVADDDRFYVEPLE